MPKTKFKHYWIETDAVGQINSPEYPYATIELAANELGKQGWELVAVVARQDEAGYRHWFKRPAE
jgi:hypothetical protein